MNLKNLAHREVVIVRPDAALAEATRLMEERNVGCVVVSDHGRPVGVLTDRDVVIRVLNKGRNPGDVRVREVMTTEPLVLSEDLSLADALEQVKGRALRRFPLVDQDGIVTGFFSMDDVVHLIGKELSAVASILEKEKMLI